MTRNDEIKLSGWWVDDSITEEVLVLVDYKISDEGFDHAFDYHHKTGLEIVKIRQVTGYETGRDYSHNLRQSPSFNDHLLDCIYERIEV